MKNGAHRSRSSSAIPAWDLALHSFRDLAPIPSRLPTPSFLLQKSSVQQAPIGRLKLKNVLRNMLLSKLQDLLGETTGKKSVVELIGLTEELGAGVRAKAQDDFTAIGMTLKSFYIGNLKPSDKSAEELRAMGMLDMQTYTQLQAADAMRDAAQNPAGGAGLTAGIGAGIGIGNIMNQSLQGTMQGGQQQAAGAAAAAASIPDVMTPAEAAAILRVSEEDVLASITAGDLKAKKLGSAYRISKGALEEFLKG